MKPKTRTNVWRRLAFVTGIAVIMAITTLGESSADWLQFRGERGSSTTSASLPVEFGGDDQRNVAWKTSLPGRGVNGPIVVGERVFATSSSGNGQKRLHVFCVNDVDGSIEWERRFWATGRTMCHPLSAVAAPTPASDGQRVFALFSSNDLVCLSLEGDVEWIRALTLEYSGAFDDRGLASSPCVIDDTLVVQICCDDDSNVFGIDPVTGQDRWVQPLAKSTNWASPCQVELDGKQLVMLQSAERLLLLDPATGERVNSHDAEGNYIPSPTFSSNIVLLPAEGMTALKIESPSEDPEVIWKEDKLSAESSSPVVWEDTFYVIRRPNLLTAGAIQDGTVGWKTRLQGSGFWATPLVADGKLYVPNTGGVVQVVDAKTGDVLAKNDVDEELLGSPAASGGALYLRGTTSLIKVVE